MKADQVGAEKPGEGDPRTSHGAENNGFWKSPSKRNPAHLALLARATNARYVRVLIQRA